jgi:hypothetical protein
VEAVASVLPAPTSATTNWTSIEVVTISDIHLGNAANPAEFVIKGLEQKLTPKYLSNIKILFLAGDIFDRGLPLNHRDVSYIASWIRRLLARCARLGIVVLVLEGTPSHDRLQSQLFVAINDAAEDQDKCDLRYVKEVSIEYIEKYDLNILCIPDEKNTSDEITLQQVRAMMEARALEKVDFAIMHGFFDFQVPVGRHTRFHDSQAYRDLVRYLIFIGHDHTFQQRGNIFVQGSPDRQRHGMEEPKGFIRALVHRDGNFEATFEVNEHAMVFKTVHVDDDVDMATSQVRNACDANHYRAHIRIAARRAHPLLAAIDTFQDQYPFITFSKKVLDEEDSQVETAAQEAAEADYVPFTIDDSNVTEVVHERLNCKLTTSEKAYFDGLMESVK